MPTVPGRERLQTHALDRVVTGIDTQLVWSNILFSSQHVFFLFAYSSNKISEFWPASVILFFKTFYYVVVVIFKQKKYSACFLRGARRVYVSYSLKWTHPANVHSPFCIIYIFPLKSCILSVFEQVLFSFLFCAILFNWKINI